MGSILEEANGLDSNNSDDRRLIDKAKKMLKANGQFNSNEIFSESAYHENVQKTLELAGQLKEKQQLANLKKKYE